MSNIFQQIIDSIKDTARESGHFHPLFAEGESKRIGEDGYYAHINQDYDEAIKLYSEALNIYPHNTYVRTNRARVYMALKDYDKALADVEFILQRIPYDLNVRELRADIYLRMGNYVSAETDFTYLIEQHPTQDNLSLYRYRAYCAIFTNKIRAIHDYTYLINMETDSNLLKRDYVNRASIYWNLDSFDNALADYLSALKIDPHYPEACEGCIQLYLKQRHYEEALDLVKHCMESDPKNVNFIKLKAQTLADMGQYKQAIADYERALAKHPDDYVIHNNLAFFAYSHLGDYEKALHHVTIAIERSSPLSAYFDTRAQVHWLMKNYDEALQDFIMVYELDRHGLGLAGQAITHFAMNNQREAITLWKKAVQADETLADPAVFADEHHYTPAYVETVYKLATLADQSKA